MKKDRSRTIGHSFMASTMGLKTGFTLRGGDRMPRRNIRGVGRLPVECIDMGPFGGEALLHNGIQTDRVARAAR